MTSEKDQIQTLIAEIETFLNKANARLPWDRFSEAEQQRQILAKTQRYLITLQQSMQAANGWGPIDPETGALSPSGGAQDRPESTSAESAQQVLQAVLQEMQYLRANLLQPLRLEVDTLQQKRQSLQQEVHQLESQRLQTEANSSQSDPSQLLSEFLQIFMDRLQSSLSEQIAQALTKLKRDSENNLLLEEFLEGDVTAADQPRLHPSQRLDQLRTVQAQSDQLLLKLDSTLKVVFETLQNNIHSYQESLSQGLSKMHGLGQQGEAIVTALITHLAQQLGRETTIYLDSGLDSSGLPGDTASQNRLLAFQNNPDLKELEDALPVTENLESLSAEFDSGELDLVLEDLNLDLDIDDDEDITLFQIDQDSPLLPFDEAEDEVSTAAQDNEEPTLIQPQSEVSAGPSDAIEAVDPLELLSRLGDTPDQDEAANSDFTSEALSESDLSPDLIELDEFYESLFGSDILSFSEGSNAENEALASLEAEDESPPEPDIVEPLTDGVSANLTLDNFLFEPGGEHEEPETPATEPSPPVLSEEVADPDAIIDAFFGDVLTPEDLNLGPDSIPDTISSLAELTPKGSTGRPALSEQTRNQPAASDGIDSLDIGLSDTLSEADSDSDLYIPAPPEEDLLVLNEPEEDSGLNLDLVNPVLQQLMNEELSSLEGLEFMESSELDLEFQTGEADESMASPPASPSESASQAQTTASAADEEASQQALTNIVNELGIPDALPDSEEDGESGLTLQKLIESEARQRDEISLSPTESEGINRDSLENLGLADSPSEGDRSVSPAPPIFESQDLESPDLESLESLILGGLGEDLGFPPTDSTALEDIGEGVILSDDDLDLNNDDSENFESELSGLSLQNVLEATTNSAQQSALLEGGEITLESLETLTLEDLMPGGEAEFALEAEFDLDPDEPPGLKQSTLARSDLSLDEPAANEASHGSGLSDRCEEERAIIPDDLAEALSAPSEGKTLSSVDQLESALVPDLPDRDERLGLEVAGQSASAIEQPLETTITPDIPLGEDFDFPPSAEIEENSQPQAWFLGIDFGSTGLSAVLMNRVGGDAYPLYWTSGDRQAPNAVSEKLFRLPTIAYLVPAPGSVNGASTSQRSRLQVEAVGPTALKIALDRNTRGTDEAADDSEDLGAAPGLLLRSLKPLLKVGIPFHPSDQETWEPTIQWSDTQQIPLKLIHESLQAIFQTLWAIDHPENPATPNSALVCGAIGLDPYQFKQALDQLQGVIIGYPANWPDTYSFNIREALLAAQLVIHPEQIFFVEDAIATVLSGLRNPIAPDPELSSQSPHQQSLYNCDWQGGAVVISAGASLTELTLVDIPQTLQELAYSDFSLRSFPYAGDAIDQDIICQLLYPLANHQPSHIENPTPSRPLTSDDGEGWTWQADLLESAPDHWLNLGLDSLELPRPGEPDLVNRRRLQQRLEDSLLGQSLLEAARHLKLILQHQLKFQLELGDQRWIIRRKELESRIFLPYIQRVNRQLNILLSQTGVSPQAINQVICTGGSASLAPIARWLRQKFPNATIIQDTYPSERPASCSRITYGLVNLARYPQVLDVVRQQYSDYFLLLELLRNFPDQPLPISGIMHLLEERGINTKVCYNHILALLEGHLPPGLLPTEQDLPLISEHSVARGNYQALGSTPLFTKQGGQIQTGEIYVPNPTQRQRLRDHLEVLMANKHQTLEEPLIAQIVQVH